MEAVAAEDPRTGLVLRHSEHEMPADRGVWRPRRPRVALAYDNNEETSQQLRGTTTENRTETTTPPTSADDAVELRLGTRHDAMPPGGARKVLLHSCCAPCSGAMFEEMLSKGLEAGALVNVWLLALSSATVMCAHNQVSFT